MFYGINNGGNNFSKGEDFNENELWGQNSENGASFFPQKNFAVIKITIFHQRIMARLEKMHFDFFIWA